MSPRSIITSFLVAATLQPMWAKNDTGLFDGWTDTDYSGFEITHEYFTPDGIAPSPSGKYDMTGYIPVKEGDAIVISADRSPGIPFMMGYGDKDGNGATVLLGDFDANNWNDLQVTVKEVIIPTGIAYVRCSARNTSVPEWARYNMSVIKRSLARNQNVVRILCIGNSFSADAVESWLSPMAKESGIQLVIGNAVRGGWGLRGHWTDIIEDNAETEYRKIVNGTYSLTPGHTLSEIINDEPWDVITFQQDSSNSGNYSTYSPYLEYLISYVKGIHPQAKLGWLMTWAYAQAAEHEGFSNYNHDQMTMYNAIVDASIQVMRDYPDLQFLIPCGTAIQNLRTSFIGDNVNRDGVHLDLKIGRLTAAYTVFATMFGEEATTQNTYHPLNQLSEDTMMMARHAALDAVRNPFVVMPQNHPDSWQYIINEHGYDSITITELTKSAKIKLAEPVCAYVNITGINQMPKKKNEDLQAWLECYDGNGNYFKKRVVLNAQGNSSLDFPKKNISVKFYEEMWGEGKTTDITFGNWVKQDAFHLKAYYTDYFRGCGKIAYDIYDDITSDREKPLPWQRAGVTTASDKAMCHPNGFPCYVYLNGKFYGLFVWSLKKNHKNMGQEKDNASHIHLDGILAAETIFNGKINWSQFEVRTPKDLYCVDTTQTGGTPTYKLYDGDNPTELIDSTMPYYEADNQGHVLTNKVKQSLIRFSKYYEELQRLNTANPDTGTIKRLISQYYDIPGLTDYFVHSLVTNNYDGHGKNWQWFTYDGNKWYVEPYDLDCTFGHHASGLLLLTPEWNCHNETRYYQFQGYAGIQKLFLKYFFDDMKDRYIALRKKHLIDVERYSTYFKTWTDRIGLEGFEMEYSKWKDSPCIRETIVNPNWTTEDNWENYNQYPTYSPDSTYHVGDKCKYIFRIWTATATTKGVRPYKQMGYTDSIERVEEWLAERMSLLDEYFDYDPDGIKDLESAKHSITQPVARKVIRDRHLYIIRDNETYSVDGKWVR
ncbi:MAG: DUF4886 domain-containing protein [Bacteroidaceae bacterium]|nr:DUF4886 domain-containing protein [Bacteroidaceae bacterium]